ncbi:MAG: hypothetical protein KF763_15225 [Cyclobacteriaceae bacterium]|nr:hypothetical protein [Cyclobacteriaceae bacterium]
MLLRQEYELVYENKIRELLISQLEKWNIYFVLRGIRNLRFNFPSGEDTHLKRI